jgi:hypothetical protein
MEADLDGVDVFREGKVEGDLKAAAASPGSLVAASASGEVEVAEIAAAQGWGLAKTTILADVITVTSGHDGLLKISCQLPVVSSRQRAAKSYSVRVKATPAQ